MQIKEIYKNLQKFVVAATGFENGKVIFASQNALTRPKKPFITIAASTFKNVGTPQETLDDAGKMTLVMPMVFVASFQAFSDVSHEAEECLSILHSQLWTELPSRVFKGSMAVRKIVKPVSAIPAILNDQTENRAILELEIGYMKTTSYQVGFIETIEIDGLINEQEIQINKRIL